MPGNLAKLVIPTGFEEEQRRAATRAMIAKALMERGLASQGFQQSATQPIAQVLSAFLGKRAQNKSDAMQSDVDKKIREAYTSTVGGLQADADAGMSNTELVRKYGGNQFAQDALKPYQDAMADALKNRENIVHTPTGYRRAGDVIGQDEFDPNKRVIPTGRPGEYTLNQAAITGALASQPNTTISNPVTTVQNPFLRAGGPPAGGGLPASPAPAGAGLDLSKLSPEEMTILQHEIQRRSGAPMGLQTDTHTPMGSPLSAVRPPAGAINGKPYWLINGVPYDNPEGK